jgi:hypothetical protein
LKATAEYTDQLKPIEAAVLKSLLETEQDSWADSRATARDKVDLSRAEAAEVITDLEKYRYFELKI